MSKYIDIMHDLLKKLALWYFVNDYLTASEYEVNNQIRDQLERLGIPLDKVDRESRHFLDSAQERSGIIVDIGQRQYSFSHNSLRDYLAAEETAGISNIEEMFNNYFKHSLHSSKNSEIIPMVAATLRLQHIDRSNIFINCILNAKTRYEDVIHSDLLLATKCITEGATAYGNTKKYIFDLLKKLSVGRSRFI